MPAPARPRERRRARLGGAVLVVVTLLCALAGRGSLIDAPAAPAAGPASSAEQPLEGVRTGADHAPTEVSAMPRRAGTPAASVLRASPGRAGAPTAGGTIPLALAVAALAVAAGSGGPRRTRWLLRADPPRRRALFAAPLRAPPTAVTF